MSDATNGLLERAGLDRETARSLVAKALSGADDGELFLELVQTEGLVFEMATKTGTFDITQGFGLRAIAGDASGYAHSGEISEAAIRRAAEAVAAVKSGHSGTYSDPPPGTNRSLYGDKNPLKSPTFGEKV
jgi:TldD protein